MLAAAATLSLAATTLPATASANEYFFSSAGSFDWILGGQAFHGARHSLTRISARTLNSSEPNVCVYGKDLNNSARNTDYYCITPGDLASTPTLAGTILRYPYIESFTAPSYAAAVRALSEW